MSLPKNIGKYIAQPVDWTVEEKDTTNEHGQVVGSNLQFIVHFNLLYYWNGQVWQDVRNEGLQIRGYFFMFKKDGSANLNTIENLKKALGWDGVDVEALQNTDWAQAEVQITVNAEEYMGKQSLKVTWITNRDADPNALLTRAEPQVVTSLSQKYGSRLRALSNPSATPAAPAARTTSARPPAGHAGANSPPTAPQTPPTAQASPAAPTAPIRAQVHVWTKMRSWNAYQDLWANFIKEFPTYNEPGRKDEVWKNALTAFLAGRNDSTLTSADWQSFAEKYLPAYDFAEIPF